MTPPDQRLTKATIEGIQSSIRNLLDEVARVQPDVNDPNVRHALISLKMAIDQMSTLLQLALARYLRELANDPPPEG